MVSGRLAIWLKNCFYERRGERGIMKRFLSHFEMFWKKHTEGSLLCLLIRFIFRIWSLVF